MLLPAVARRTHLTRSGSFPHRSDALGKVENPRELYDAVYNHEVFQELLKMDSVAAFYDTTNFRRLLQFVSYFEKELGHDRLELLDRLTGGGVLVAGQFEKKAVLAVVQAKDEDLLKRFIALARKIATQELSRLDSKEQLEARPYRELETFHLGKTFHLGRAGSAAGFLQR